MKEFYLLRASYDQIIKFMSQMHINKMHKCGKEIHGQSLNCLESLCVCVGGGVYVCGCARAHVCAW